MDQKTKNRIKNCGLKQKYIAEKLNITANYFSMCLNGKRNLSEEKIQKLKQLL